jgi:hypothetical protein
MQTKINKYSLRHLHTVSVTHSRFEAQAGAEWTSTGFRYMFARLPGELIA